MINNTNCNCQKLLKKDEFNICTVNCDTCNKLTTQITNKTCNYLAKGSYNYAFNFTINKITYIFKIQDDIENIITEDLKIYIDNKIFTKHILFNSIYIIRSYKLNYYNNNITKLTEVNNLIEKEFNYYNMNKKIITIQKNMNSDITVFFNKIDNNNMLIYEFYILLYILDSLIQLCIFKKNNLNYSDFKLENIMFSDYPRNMFQIIDFSLKPSTPMNNFILEYYYETRQNNYNKIIMQQEIIQFNKTYTEYIITYLNQNYINENIYYDLNCFIFSLYQLFNNIIYNKEYNIIKYKINNVINYNKDLNKILNKAIYDYIKNKNIDNFCNIFFNSKNTNFTPNIYIKNLLKEILKIYYLSKKIDNIFYQNQKQNIFFIPNNININIEFINIINKEKDTNIYENIYKLVLNYYCNFKFNDYDIKLEVLNEIYNNSLYKTNKIYKLQINEFQDQIIIDMYNYIMNDSNDNYDKIKDYIKDIYDIKNNNITKKDIYIGNDFYDVLYNKLNQKILNEQEQKRLDEQRKLEEPKRQGKKGIFDTIVYPNSTPKYFNITNYGELLNNYNNLDFLIDELKNNINNNNKYVFNKDDNYKLQLFLNKIDITSNYLTDSKEDINKKNDLIMYLVFFVISFIDDQIKNDEQIKKDEYIKKDDQIKKVNLDNIKFEIITKCILIISKLSNYKNIYDDLLSRINVYLKYITSNYITSKK